MVVPTSLIVDPIADRLGIWQLRGIWSWFVPVIVVADLLPFIVFGTLIAVGHACWRGVVGRRMWHRAARGTGIGVMVGFTYYTISSTISAIDRFASMHDCILILPTYVDLLYDYKTITPYLHAFDPADGATCVSPSIESIAFFLIFIALGIGVAYVRGRNKQTGTVNRLVKGAVFGLLTAGTLTPITMFLDILRINLWHWFGIV